MKLQGLLSACLQSRGLPLVVLALVMGLTLMAWQQERLLERHHRHESFDAALREASLRIEQRMAAHEHLLQGLQGFVRVNPSPSATALARYVDALPLGADFVGVQGLLRLEYRVQGPASAPVVQVEPALASNQALLGRDLLADGRTRQALERARDSGRMALSDRLELATLGLAPGTGILMVLPLYEGGGMPEALADRRARLQAWVAAPVRMQTLMASLYGEMPAGLRLELHGGQTLSEANLLHRDERPLQTVVEGREYLVLGGQTWTLSLRVGPDFDKPSGATGPNAVLAVGAGFALLLAMLAWLLGHARERAQALAERMTKALRESEQRWAMALDGAGDGVWDWTPASARLKTTQRWRELMGLSEQSADIPVQLMLGRVNAEDLPRLQTEMRHCVEGGADSLVCEYRVGEMASADRRWVLMRGTVVERDERGRPQRLIGTLSDITVRRESEEKLRFMALQDPLTELANRAHFEERLRFALANARRYGESIGLILLDLDRFKPVNDQHGHAVGDQLLQAVARRIRSSVRETDTVGRIGGDEFVVLLTGPITRETAQRVADKIFNQVASPLELGGLRLEITCSLGLALYPEDGQDELALTKAADEAMYRNKRMGRAAIHEARSNPPGPAGGELRGS